MRGRPIRSTRCIARSPGDLQRGGKKIHAPAGATVQGGANASASSDRHLTVVNQSSSPVYVYDLWKVQTPQLPPGGNVTISLDSGGRSRLDGNGSAEGAGQGTAAHFSDLAGLIRAEEFAAGEIKHALAIAMSCDSGSFVAPAAGSGLKCGNVTNAPPMGARLQLKMSTSDIEALRIPRWKKIVLTAMARYGAFVSDTGTDGYWHFQTESGIQYFTGGAADQWWQFGLANGWAPYAQVPCYRTRGGITQFVNEQVIADQQSILHRPRRNHKRLPQSGRTEQQKQHRNNPLGNPVLLHLESLL